MGQTDITLLKPHPMNDKIYSKTSEQDDELLESIRAEGILVPIVINPGNYIVSGHRRYGAAVKLGMEKVPTVTKHFADLDEEAMYLLVSNQYRHKTNEEKIREGKKMAEILTRRGNGRVRDQVGKQIDMSGRTYDKGAEVIDKIDALEETDPEKAAELREKLNKSVDGAYKASKDVPVEAKPDDEEEDLEADYSAALARAEERRLFFYLTPLKDLLRQMEGQYKVLSSKRTTTTPRALGHMIGNIKDMATRLESWLPQNLTDCPECKGTGKVSAPGSDGKDKEVACDYCINGKVGLHKVTAS